MIYRLKQYQQRYYPEKSIRTVLRMIRNGKFYNENQKLINDDGYDILIQEVSFQELSSMYCDAAIEFNSAPRASRNHERAASICIKYDLSMKHFCKIVGL